MSALQALNHPFITEISEQLISEINDVSTKEGEYLNRVAKSSLNQMKIYKPYITDENGKKRENSENIKQAILQMFVAILISDDEKYAMKTVFKIMDKSGDGKIEDSELR